jgi:long-chain acyl-CoA synthetase
VKPGTLVDLYRIGLVERARDDAFLHKVDGVYRPVPSREVVERITRVCAALIDVGIRPGDRVGILSETRLDWMVADFAVLTSGAVTVPIYPTLPAVQIEPLLADSEVTALFCSTPVHFEKVLACWPRLAALKLVVLFEGQASTRPLPGRVATLPEFESAGTRRLERDPRLVDERAASLTSEHLASIIYTSGTTGAPKGVMLTHGNFLANVRDGLEVFGISPADTTLSHLPLSHLFERTAGQFAPILAGARIAYADAIETLAANMLEVRPTIVMSVPRLFEKILERAQSVAQDVGGYAVFVFRSAVSVGVAWSRAEMKGRASPVLSLARRVADRLLYARLRARMGGNVRCMISGGAPLDPLVAHVLHAARIPLLEGYGLTETSPVIAVNREGHWRIGTVGPPLPSVEVRIAEDGEIAVRGPNVMKGYYRKPRETEEAMSDGWFHTGDLGKLEEGFLSITGRKKDLIVNAGGKKVAPQPIEDLLRRIPIVSEAMLVGDRRPYCVALLWPNVPALETFARREGLSSADLATLVKDPHVLEYLRREIDARSSALASFERVKRFALVDREPTLANGEITPSLKIRRAKVQERYADLIESLYAD